MGIRSHCCGVIACVFCWAVEMGRNVPWAVGALGAALKWRNGEGLLLGNVELLLGY